MHYLTFDHLGDPLGYEDLNKSLLFLSYMIKPYFKSILVYLSSLRLLLSLKLKLEIAKNG